MTAIRKTLERPTWRLLAATLLALPSLAPAAAEGDPGAPPSLVLVTIDTLRADRLGCYGYDRPTTPHLDAFANEAHLFENAFTTMATTLPAHASIMTGTHPLTHTIVANTAFLPRTLDDSTDLRTLAEMLADRDYATAAFVSAAPLKRSSGIDRGFEVFSQPSSLQRSARKTTRQVLDWLDELERTDAAPAGRPHEPFFLWVHYFDPHWPYSPPREARESLGSPAELVPTLRRLGVDEKNLSKLVRINDAYDAEVRHTDAEVGRLFARLEDLGLWDRSIIVVTADHGEGLGQHDYLYHGRIHDEQLRVPLLIKMPGQQAGGRSTAVTSLVDLVPILASTGGLPIFGTDRRQLQGRNTLRTESSDRTVLSERTHRKGSWGPQRRYALTGERWKLLHTPEGDTSLYDLGSDPHETRDVLDEHPDVVHELLAALADRIRSLYREPDPEAAGERDEETLRQLRALGYVE